MDQHPVVAIDPVEDRTNSFVRLFSDAVAAQGYRVASFDWARLRPPEPAVAIIHWPFELVGAGGLAGLRRLIRAHWRLFRARRAGLKAIWVAHNVRPHDGGRFAKRLMGFFVRRIDGVLYLSEASRRIIRAEYAIPRRVQEVVSVHGHYLDVMATAPSVGSRPQGEIRLGYFGAVRPYKNVDLLAARLAEMDGEGVSLTVTGRRGDAALAAELECLAASAGNIRLDLRPEPLPDAALEAAVDAADAIVLPYRDILNSGAALFALSRFRPVMAPRLGSLAELQETVGRDWVWLYDGELTLEVLREFLAWMRSRDASAPPDLSAFDWERVGRDVARLIAACLSGAKK